MYHGLATLKKELVVTENVTHEVGKQGIISAFLEEQDIYAVVFPKWSKERPENWITFKGDDTISGREVFESYFDYELNEM